MGGVCVAAEGAAVTVGAYETDYLVIGNSAAGVTAAETLRAHDAQARILMVSNEPHAAYGRPLISYLLEGKTDRGHMDYREPDFYDTNRLDTLFGPEHAVVRLDAEAHQAVCADGAVLSYKKCLLATGSAPAVPPIPGAEGYRNVHCFLTLDDALNVWDDAVASTERAHAEGRTSRAVIIGAGLIGLKAAEALTHHVDEVVVFARGNRILPSVLDAQGSALMIDLLEKRGIQCRTGVSAAELCGEAERVTSALLTDGTELACDMVILAVGVRPASGLAVDAGAEEGRGLIVGPDLKTTLADVYAAGDVTQVTDRLTGVARPLALWPNAVVQGRIAALHMAGVPDAPAFVDSFAVNAVDFFDISLLTSGIINPAEGDGCAEILLEEKDTFAKFVTRDDTLVGYLLLNRPENAGIYTALIEDKVSISTLDAHIFERDPQNLDFSAQARWSRLHTGYPANRDEKGWLRTESQLAREGGRS